MANKGNKVTPYVHPPNLNIGILIFAAIFIYVIVCVVMYFRTDHIVGYNVMEGSLTSNSIFKGIALRTEEVGTATDAAYVNYFAREGERVAKGDLVYTVDETGKPLAPYSGVQGIHVLKFAAENKAEAVKELLAALTDPSIGVSLALASGCAPANVKCYDDPQVAQDELVQAMRTTAEIAVPMPNIPEMDVMWTVTGNLLTDVNLSGRDIGESFDAALAQANDLISAMK